MEKPWFILSSRFGGDTRVPSIEDLRRALAEVFVENHPTLTQADYEEHPSSFVRWGTDAGPMYVISVGRARTAKFEQWTDQDYGDELAGALTIENVAQEEALRMWCTLQAGHVDELRSEFEQRGSRVS